MNRLKIVVFLIVVSSLPSFTIFQDRFSGISHLEKQEHLLLVSYDFLIGDKILNGPEAYVISNKTEEFVYGVNDTGGKYLKSKVKAQFISEFEIREERIDQNLLNSVYYSWIDDESFCFKTEKAIYKILEIFVSDKYSLFLLNGTSLFVGFDKSSANSVLNKLDINSFLIDFDKSLLYDSVIEKVNSIDIEVLKSSQEVVDFISYKNTGIQQIGFTTKPMRYAEVTLFPRLIDRNKLGVLKLQNVYGINQFYMDHDLVTGFVHPYTANFMRKLPSDGYVMKLTRDHKRVNQARVRYVQKKDLGYNDKLGQNYAFARQWKLSEILMDGYKIYLKKCKYSKYCNCIQTNSGSKNPYSSKENQDIPLYSEKSEEGFNYLNKLGSLDYRNGGTVDIVWSTERDQVLFITIHGSIKDIISKARQIRDQYGVDPVLAIYDAGTYARKFKADSFNNVSFKDANSHLGHGEFLGAGFGYTYDLSER